jgi:hypothetical protein
VHYGRKDKQSACLCSRFRAARGQMTSSVCAWVPFLRREKRKGAGGPSLLLRFCVCSWQSGNETHLWEGVKGRREKNCKLFGKRCFISSAAPFVVCRFTHIIFCFLVACQLLWAESQLGPRLTFRGTTQFFSLCWNNMYTPNTFAYKHAILVCESENGRRIAASVEGWLNNQ